MFCCFDCSRFPFDWKNPIGYLIAVTLQYIMIMYMFFVISSMLSLGIGAFMFSVKAVDDVKMCMKSVNECAIVKGKQSKAFKRIAGYIQLHAYLKQLSESFFLFYLFNNLKTVQFFFEGRLANSWKFINQYLY